MRSAISSGRAASGIVGFRAVRFGIVAAAMSAVALMAGVGSPDALANDSGHDIAEKFAKDAEKAAAKERARAALAQREQAQQRTAAEQAKAEEQDMLLRARREAEDLKRAQALAAKPVGDIAAPSDPLDAEQQRKLELDRIAAKLKMAREAREAKLAREAKAAAEALATKTAEAPKAPPTKAQVVGDTAWTAEVNKEPANTPEIDTTSRSALGGPAINLGPDAGGSAGAAKASAPVTKVTVLMVLAPGNKGIRRFDKTADPVLCTQDGCYVSAGGTQPAIQKPLHKVLGPGNTFGRRAGECNHALGCVFRGVDVGASQNYLQPVDLKVMVHDRRRQAPLVADTSCRHAMGQLTCDRPVVGEDYKMWVVPEHVAEEAGPAGLARAIADGLATTRAADAGLSVRR
jgi:hypothetical protein